jgi:hypothetical protein
MLEKQIEAIRNQSIPVKSEDIHVWYNKSHVVQHHPKDKNVKTYVCNWNTKFFGRFTVPLLVNTPYVALFDDDILPQKDWLKNCIETIENPESNGILGGIGIVLQGRGYDPHDRIGWNGTHSDKVEQVDLVGHAWFFRQEWAKYMWYEKPHTFENGEDITFAFLAQKYGGINSFIPPHPENNPELWCSDLEIGNEVGSDENSSWRNIDNFHGVRDEICRLYINDGWKTVNNIK